MLVPVVLYVIALALRVAWVLAVPSKPVGDFAMYIESATHLLAHGRFDPQFIYMPGYIFIAAAVQALGGKWLALKLTGAALAALGAPLCHGIAARLWDRRVAAAAGALYAVWPGGIGVASVTGTDIPASIFVALGVYAVVRATPEKPWRAAGVGGALLGLGAWVRAVAVPLAPLTAWLFWARSRSVRRTVIATAAATAAALLVLAPWGVRNHARYGSFFLTDSHGGLTALVGAFPNSDGQFTRALNRSFEEATGIAWLSEPHRTADALAYAEAKRWTRFEPAYALGLALQRADKLLSNERSLLYWPLYRAGVLPPPRAATFESWRREIECATDVFWWFLLLGCVAAVPLAVSRRNWLALGLLPLQLALVGVYVLFFAESRYHLTIAVLAFPGAAATAVHAIDAARAAVAATRVPTKTAVDWRPLIGMVVTIAIAMMAWRAFLSFGEALRERHRFAVHACEVAGSSGYCLWKRADGGAGASPVRGTFDGVGLRVRGEPEAAASVVALREGAHRLRATGSLVPTTPGARIRAATFVIELNGEERFRRTIDAEVVGEVDVSFDARAGDNHLVWRVIPIAESAQLHANAWLDGLVVEKMP